MGMSVQTSQYCETYACAIDKKGHVNMPLQLEAWLWVQAFITAARIYDHCQQHVLA